MANLVYPYVGPADIRAMVAQSPAGTAPRPWTASA
ncbi:hypothetical protein ABH926_001348 [Catenulispora sp. GP43]